MKTKEALKKTLIFIIILIISILSSFYIGTIAHETTHFVFHEINNSKNTVPEYVCFSLLPSENRVDAFITFNEYLNKPRIFKINEDTIMDSWVKKIDFSKEEKIASSIGILVWIFSFSFIFYFINNRRKL